jgi:hypothetical protein
VYAGGGRSKNEKERHARLNEHPPPLLALRALHPVLVELGELRVVVLRELRERLERVVVDLLVDSGGGV